MDLIDSLGLCGSQINHNLSHLLVGIDPKPPQSIICHDVGGGYFASN
jgi:hypothetical protein